MSAQTLGFQAEVKQLLHLMINALYSNKEIFLRELISNASDACDKLRFESLNNPALSEESTDFKIRVAYDQEKRTITVSDNGIGLSQDEAIAHLGTIAKSGTKEFFESLTGDAAKDAHLIGQFGVGFYSAFIVADEVEVFSRRAGLKEDEAVLWKSKGEGEFSVEKTTKKTRGTDVVLHLKESENEFLNAWTLKNIITKYSDHITIAIVMEKEEFKDNKAVKTGEDETVNQASALWARAKNEITDEEYQAFYKHVAHDFENPLAWTHAKIEGKQEYTLLLYLPQHAPFDLWDRNAKHGVKLYVKRVFIMDEAQKLLPLYLRFVKGVIDSADLPLNVSREILQESRDIDAIRAGATRRVLALLEDLAKNKPDDYKKFYAQFGSVLKEGVGEDFANQAKIAALLRFQSTQSDEANVSFADYIARMKAGQDKIYYLTAETLKAAQGSPHLEIFKKKGIEVLLLTERVDEWLVAHLNEFDGKKLQSVTKGGLDLGDLEDKSEKENLSKTEDDFKELLAKIKEVLNEKIKEVRLTLRLTDSPACLVSDEFDPSGNLARILKSAGQAAPHFKPILEINPNHPAVLRLKTETAHFNDWATLLFEEASLAEGGQLEDPAGFVKRVNTLMLALSK